MSIPITTTTQVPAMIANVTNNDRMPDNYRPSSGGIGRLIAASRTAIEPTSCQDEEITLPVRPLEIIVNPGLVRSYPFQEQPFLRRRRIQAEGV